MEIETYGKPFSSTSPVMKKCHPWFKEFFCKVIELTGLMCSAVTYLPAKLFLFTIFSCELLTHCLGVS